MSEQRRNVAGIGDTNASSAPALVKQVLLNRRRELTERVRAVERDLERKGDPHSANRNERASERGNDEVLEAIGGVDARELANINSALRRLELGTYGPCTLCGRLIAAERLRALPHAEYCERCARVYEAEHPGAR